MSSGMGATTRRVFDPFVHIIRTITGIEAIDTFNTATGATTIRDLSFLTFSDIASALPQQPIVRHRISEGAAFFAA